MNLFKSEQDPALTSHRMQGESIMAMTDPGEVILTLEMIEQSRYAEYRHTVLAGRVAAIVGVQLLADSAARPDKSLRTQLAGMYSYFGKLPSNAFQI